MENIQSIGEIAIFNTGDGDVHVQVDAVNETVWMNQKGMAELFGVRCNGFQHILSPQEDI